MTKYLILLLLLTCGILLHVNATESNKIISKHAHFTVTTDIVNPDVKPFSATISGFGNSLIKNDSSFEPIIYRNQFIAAKNDKNRIFIESNALTHYDSLREGFFEGADIYLYRINNGEFDMVRKDRVAVGGSNSSGWIPVLMENNIIPVTNTTFRFYWESWNKPNSDYYFTVRAISKYGHLSPPAASVRIKKPSIEKKDRLKNFTVKFTPAQTFFSQPSPIPMPKNLTGKLTKKGGVLLAWDPVNAPDLAGYIIYRSDYAPDKHKGYFLQLKNKAVSTREYIRKGDMVLISRKIYSPSRDKLLTNRVWGALGVHKGIMPELLTFFPDEHASKTWALTPYTAPSPSVEQPGETYLTLTLNDNSTESVTIYNHGGTGQSWYDVLEKKKYTIEVWLRKEGAGTVKFKMTDRAPYNIEPIEFSVGKTWKKYTASFIPEKVRTDSQPQRMLLEFAGPGIFHIDNFRVYSEDSPYLAFSDDEIKSIQSSKVPFLRTHGLIKTGSTTYDIEQLTNPAGVISNTSRSNTLPQTLGAIKKAKTNPWLQIEFHLTPYEWLSFVEYIAAPYNPDVDTPQSKPWAYKRYKQGQIIPWVDEFDKIYFELSNETWNRLFRPWVFNQMKDSVTNEFYSTGKVYGIYQEYVISILRSSPYWNKKRLDNKFSFVLGGWAANKKYGEDAISHSNSTTHLAIAAYNGGWDENEAPPKLNAQSVFNLLSHTSQTAIPVAIKHVQITRKLSSYQRGKLKTGTYEAGPGYVLNGLNNARINKKESHEQELVMKSLSAGTATIDSFLARAYHGFSFQNFFTFDQGDKWKSHAKWHRGGHAYPSWKMISLFNNVATGDMLRIITHDVPSSNLKSFGRRKAVKNAPLVAVYATKKAERYAVYVISRKAPQYLSKNDEGYTPVKISLPFKGSSSTTLYRMTGNSYSNNAMADDVKVEKIIIPSNKGNEFILNEKTGADKRGLPPSSTYLYIFNNVSM